MKKGIIILLYSVALIGVMGLILISTYDPQNFTIEIGQSHKEIVKTSELIQNYQNYLRDNALFAAEDSRYISDKEEYQLNFINSFEKRMNQYPSFYEEYDLFEYSIYMDYVFEFADNKVTITGSPDYTLDFDVYFLNEDFIDFEEKLIRDSILITNTNSEFKFYPYFKINSDYGLNNPQNDEENNE